MAHRYIRMVATRDNYMYMFGVMIGVIGGMVLASCILIQPSVVNLIDSLESPHCVFFVVMVVIFSILVNVEVGMAIGSCIYEIRQRRYVEIADPLVHQRELEYLQILSYQ
jgi:hypothetical protein